MAVFQALEKFVKQTPGLQDISIIFFTDGCDTCSNMSAITASLDKFKKVMAQNNVTSRFLTIGFTSAHDAAFLNRIA